MANPRVKPLTPREADGLLRDLHDRLRIKLARHPFPGRGAEGGGRGSPDDGPPSPPSAPAS